MFNCKECYGKLGHAPYCKQRHQSGCPELKAKQHKWHKEIIAWADGATIQYKSGKTWIDTANNKPTWNLNDTYRIKPASTTIKGYVNIYLYEGKYPSYGRVIYESKNYAEEQGAESTAYLKTVEISETIEV